MSQRKGEVRENERSWAIDVIVEINIWLSNRNTAIKRAGGERTLTGDSNNLFPDVILYGDSSSGSVLQGWELKMPDTPIDDVELINNATTKANILQLESFLIWNAREAVLYRRNENGFFPIESWHTPQINNRNDVQSNVRAWKATLIEILEYLSKFLDSSSYHAASLLEIGHGLYTQSLTLFTPVLSEYYKKLSVQNFDFYIEISDWADENRLANENEKFTSLSEFVILAWMNRFIFAHYLKTFSSDALIIENINKSSSLDEVLLIFREISNKCDFMNIFIGTFGDQYIPTNFLSHLLQLNEFLKNIRLKDVEIEILQDVVENSFSQSSKKIAGQFATPPNLARFVSEITIKDRNGTAIDPCCGSGTIPKAIYQMKRELGIAPATALEQIWASDKYAYPLQLCSIALSDPSTLGHLVQVFKRDVFDLKNGEAVSFVDPFVGKMIDKEIPLFQSVVSNLPFVESNILEKKYRLETLASTIGEPPLHGKSDLFAYIVIHLANLVPDGGRIGIITSNSWLGSGWGVLFKRRLLQNFKLLRVVCSASGRWFQNADVVGLVAVIEKSPPTPDHKIEFISLSTNIHNWDKDQLQASVHSTLGKGKSSTVVKNSFSADEINAYERLGLSWSALFTNLSWLEQVKSKLVNASEFLEIDRGMRRGWDRMFYPETGHGIEAEYIRPVVMNSTSFGDRLINPNTCDAFCCSKSVEDLEREGHYGALTWIRKFERAVNGKGKPLPVALARSNLKWYEMPDSSQADLAISMNPDKKLGVFLLPKRSFVNQRLISIRCEKISYVKILHALMNSTLGLFYIEAIGFGKGLGALDLSATNIRNKLHVLDFRLLDDIQRRRILDKFQPILDRGMLNLPEELKQEDRKLFDQTVFSAFGINLDIEVVYHALQRLYEIRKSVDD